MLYNQSSASQLRLAELIAVLSLPTDLATGQPLEHALRSCVLAVGLGKCLEVSVAELRDIYYLALLRMIGCTAEQHVAAAALGDELAAGRWFATVDPARPTHAMGMMLRHLGAGHPLGHRARMLVTAFAQMSRVMETRAAHCEVAGLLALRLGFGSDIQTALAQVYERWDGKGAPNGIKGEQIVRPMRVVHLAVDVDTFYQLGGSEAAITMARQRAGRAFDPTIVARFCREAPGLLAALNVELIWDTVLAAEPGPHPHLSGAQLDTGLRAIADFVDLKSPYFAGHSRGVADLAAEAGRRCRLPEEDIMTVWRAGLLHDLGRVSVSAGIWQKPGPLTAGEWERVRLHPYYTERVLARSRGLGKLGALAALHHERLDGSGYHRGAPAALLSLAARLLAAADVYHALTEPRPHRPARSPELAADELRREVRAGRLDGEATHAVLAAAGHRMRRMRRDWPAGLSAREVDVLRLIARGLSNHDMARQLSVSESTVHHHIQHIYTKVGVSTRAAATLFAMQHDLLSE